MYGDGVMPAGRAWYWQVLYSVQCREPKTGQQKVQLSSKTKHFSHLGMINLLSTRTLLIPPTPYTKDFVQGVCAIHTQIDANILIFKNTSKHHPIDMKISGIVYTYMRNMFISKIGLGSHDLLPAQWGSCLHAVC